MLLSQVYSGKTVETATGEAANQWEASSSRQRAVAADRRLSAHFYALSPGGATMYICIDVYACLYASARIVHRFVR